MDNQGWDEQQTEENDRPISRRIIHKVSKKEGREADKFDENLYDAIDPDALNQIFEEMPAETRLEFPFRGHLVVVHGCGTIELDSQQESAPLGTE